jgi:hypothetical protein
MSNDDTSEPNNNATSTSSTAASNISNSAMFHQQMWARPKTNELFVFSNGWMTNSGSDSDGMTFNSNYGHRNGKSIDTIYIYCDTNFIRSMGI